MTYNNTNIPNNSGQTVTYNNTNSLIANNVAQPNNNSVSISGSQAQNQY